MSLQKRPIGHSLQYNLLPLYRTLILTKPKIILDIQSPKSRNDIYYSDVFYEVYSAVSLVFYFNFTVAYRITFKPK